MSETKVPLPQWLGAPHPQPQLFMLSDVKHELILRKLKVAYALANLIRHAAQDQERSSSSSYTSSPFDETLFQPDNFVVRLMPTPTPAPTSPQLSHPLQLELEESGRSSASTSTSMFTTNIIGVDMLSSSSTKKTPLRLTFLDVDVLNSFGDYDGQNECPFPFELETTEIVDSDSDQDMDDDDGTKLHHTGTGCNIGIDITHFLGVLLHELFAGKHSFPDNAIGLINEKDELRWRTHSSSGTGEPLLKKKTMADMFTSIAIVEDSDDGGVNHTGKEQLSKLGFPSSLSLLVMSLLEFGRKESPDDYISSLNVAIDNTIEELQLLLADPDRFLFDSSTSKTINVKHDKLYGREKEATLIKDAFYRVSSSGVSEVLLVDGFSGCGKSKLIQSVIGEVNEAGTYIIQGKFEEIARNSSQIAVLTNALNQLCVLICETNRREVLNDIVIELMTIFGSHLYALFKVLPNIVMLSDQVDFSLSQHTPLNLNSVPYMLMIFLRIVTSKSRPVMICLDDLHWADTVSLNVIRCILSDMKGSNRVFFVGSYRSNGIKSQNQLLRMFVDKLQQCQVQLTEIHLDGLEVADLNKLVSDALGLFPRISWPLSNIIQRKTEGNPLYVLEFLKSLAERNLLGYSLREKRWVWNEAKIESEQISESVSELLAQKISNIPEERRRALKIVSCFGTSVSSNVVSAMAEVAEYSFLGRELESAYSAGFLERDIQSGGYKFAHDKVREATYSQMKEDDRNRLHYDIGIALMGIFARLVTNEMLFLCADQLNRGQAIISCPEEILQSVQMNHNAASVALEACDFTAAHRYAHIALTQYNLLAAAADTKQSAEADGMGILSVLANAAYACGHLEEASNAIEAILEHEDSLDEKLKFDVYDLKITMLVSRQEGKSAYITCLEVLRKLGDDAASPFAPEANDSEFCERLCRIASLLQEMTESDLMTMREMTDPTHLRLMHFYNQIAVVSYFVKPQMIKRITCRLVELTLEHGVSKYTALSMVRFAMTMPSMKGYKIGKMATSLGEKFDVMDQIPSIYLGFYGYIAVYAQPIQSCADMLKRAFEIGLSKNDPLTFHNGNQYIHKCLLAGTNLRQLRTFSDYQIRIIEENNQTTANMYAKLLNATILTLMNKDAQIEFIGPRSDSETERGQSKNPEYDGSITFHSAIKSFWLGHYDRCLYHCERGITLSDIKQLKSVMMIFYSGISACHSRKSAQSNRVLKRIIKDAIKVMKEREEDSAWNFANKLHLLQAESYSVKGKNGLASKSYAAAIETSKSSKFVHEQGLSCELAALHFMRMNDMKKALAHFEEAKACYEQWGAQIKVDAIIQQVNKIQSET